MRRDNESMDTFIAQAGQSKRQEAQKTFPISLVEQTVKLTNKTFYNLVSEAQDQGWQRDTVDHGIPLRDHDDDVEDTDDGDAHEEELRLEPLI